jgi:pimeloyl-ACP methyl ester carboxylesterase
MKIKTAVRNTLRLFALVLIVFSFFTYYSYNNEDSAKLDQLQANSSNKMVLLSQGLTRFQIHGEQHQPTIILIHSFNGFLESWQPNIQALVKAGFKVVTYDLYGRGLSARPWGDYNLDLFRNQLKELIEVIGIEQAHLVGGSFGSVIAADYALKFPTQVRTLSFIGPAGWPDDGSRSPLLDVPLISDAVFHYLGQSILKPKVMAYFHKLSQHQTIVNQWEQFAAIPGFTRASLSILKNAPVFDYTYGWEQLGQMKTPILFIWGKQDVSFPFHHTSKISKLMPQAELIAIDEAAHWVNIEQAAQVNAGLIAFLQSSL